MKFDEESLVCRLQDKVNSALLTFDNHTSDNGFFEDTLREFIDSMNDRHYEPVGISLNIPFECATSSMAIGFAFKDLEVEEVRWVHMPETYWFHLLAEYYGRKQADMIIEELTK